MLPYTPRQLGLLLVVVALAGLGEAVDRWRRSYPDRAEELERLDRTAASTSVAPRAAADPDTGDRAAPEPHSDVGRAGRPPAVGSPVAAPIDLNRAEAAELARLPGIGPALAVRITAFREAAGPFASADDLRRVPGIGRKTFERMRPLVTAGE